MLSTPPAFILSQDQTLVLKIRILSDPFGLFNQSVKSGKNTVLTLDLRLFFKNFSVNLQGCCLLFCCQGAYCPLTRSACLYYHLQTPHVNHFFQVFLGFFQGFFGTPLSCVLHSSGSTISLYKCCPNVCFLLNYII